MEQVFSQVSHRQVALTILKRLRIFFRNDRRLLGKLCCLAYETIGEALRRLAARERGCSRGGIFCLDYRGEKKIIGFIDKCQEDMVVKILWHCGLWKEAVSRPPPVGSRVVEGEPSYDDGYFERVCV